MEFLVWWGVPFVRSCCESKQHFPWRFTNTHAHTYTHKTHAPQNTSFSTSVGLSVLRFSSTRSLSFAAACCCSISHIPFIQTPSVQVWVDMGFHVASVNQPSCTAASSLPLKGLGIWFCHSCLFYNLCLLNLFGTFGTRRGWAGRTRVARARIFCLFLFRLVIRFTFTFSFPAHNCGFWNVIRFVNVRIRFVASFQSLTDLQTGRFGRDILRLAQHREDHFWLRLIYSSMQTKYIIQIQQNNVVKNKKHKASFRIIQLIWNNKILHHDFCVFATTSQLFRSVLVTATS